MIVITPNGQKSPWPPPDISIYISRYRSTYKEDSHHNTQVCLHIPEVLEIDSPNPVQSWLQKLVHSLHYGLRNNKAPWFYCNNEQWILVEKLSVPRAALGHLNHADHLSTTPTPSTPMMMNGPLMLQLPEVRERPRFDVADIRNTYSNVGEDPIQTHPGGNELETSYLYSHANEVTVSPRTFIIQG